MVAAPSSSPSLIQAFLEEYNGWQLQAVCISFILIDTVFVVLRFWARSFHQRPLDWDDLLIFIAWINLLGLEIDGIRKHPFHMLDSKKNTN